MEGIIVLEDGTFDGAVDGKLIITDSEIIDEQDVELNRQAIIAGEATGFVIDLEELTQRIQANVDLQRYLRTCGILQGQ